MKIYGDVIKTSVVDVKCDTCGESIYKTCIGIPIIVEFSYGHPLDGNTYEFCSNKCMLTFLIAEIKKEMK
jgi:hypothetical protein